MTAEPETKELGPRTDLGLVTTAEEERGGPDVSANPGPQHCGSEVSPSAPRIQSRTQLPQGRCPRVVTGAGTFKGEPLKTGALPHVALFLQLPA